jgi:hypothetical protein
MQKLKSLLRSNSGRSSATGSEKDAPEIVVHNGAASEQQDSAAKPTPTRQSSRRSSGVSSINSQSSFRRAPSNRVKVSTAIQVTSATEDLLQEVKAKQQDFSNALTSTEEKLRMLAIISQASRLASELQICTSLP